MQAAVLSARKEPLAIENVPDPDCPRDGVALKEPACGVCRSDRHGRAGEHPRARPGRIGGHGHCGEVVAAGRAARHATGDRLIAPFILACGTSANRRSGGSNVCLRLRPPGFTEPVAFAEHVAVPRDLSPILAREVGLSDASAERVAFNATTQPGISVIADLAAQAAET